jgi:hypothetical protein
MDDRPSAERDEVGIKDSRPVVPTEFAHSYAQSAFSVLTWQILATQVVDSMVPGGGVEPPRTEVRRILSRRGASAKLLKNNRFQSLHKSEVRGMRSFVRSRRDLSLTVYAQSGTSSSAGTCALATGHTCEHVCSGTRSIQLRSRPQLHRSDQYDRRLREQYTDSASHIRGCARVKLVLYWKRTARRFRLASTSGVRFLAS